MYNLYSKIKKDTEDLQLLKTEQKERRIHEKRKGKKISNKLLG